MADLDPQRQRHFALDVLGQLRDAGYEAYWAGGCVRDYLLERAPKDYDVATSATPAEVSQVFKRRKTLQIGAAFGVVAVVGPRPAGTVEVTTFRRDAQYSDGRHPDKVEFSSAEEDARRRDFTINGLFFDPMAGRVIDFVGGQGDLQQGIVRAIGDPRARFGEDKLRMLRAVRMAATFGFEIEAATRDALQDMASQVTVVSAERIAQELRLLLVLPERRRGAELLAETGLLPAILPELAAAADRPSEISESTKTCWQYTLEILGALQSPTFTLALAALVQCVGSADAAKAVAARLKLSNKETDELEMLVVLRNSLRGAATGIWARVQRILTGEIAAELVQLREAQVKVEGVGEEDTRFCREKLALPADVLDPRPVLTGDDLVAHGIKPGFTLGRLLWFVRDAQLEGSIRTKAEALQLVDQLLIDWTKP